VNDEEFDRRRRRLDEALAARKRQEQAEQERARKTGSAAGYAVALRLSSEFIVGILLGTGIGWLVDQLAGTSPWGLIVFFLLGFCAGVLNVLRSAGLVAEPSIKRADRDTGSSERED
jgi:ATP synthase protein I